MNARLAALPTPKLRDEYGQQGSFLYIEDFLPRDFTERLIAAVHDVMPSVNRNYLPGHKAGGSVSRHTLDKLAPFIADLYRSDALIKWLESITGDKLQLSPQDDPHAYALYFYTRPGDHIGWHYDTSYYDGRRYTLLLGVIDDSSCKLDYELHTKTPGIPDQPGSVQISARRVRVLRRRQAAPSRHAARRERDARVAHVRVRDEPQHASVPALHLEHEGLDRVFRVPAGLSPQGRQERTGMSRAGTFLLSVGVVLFVALLGWQGFGSVASTLAAAGWGLLAVAAFHFVPLVIDAGAISVLFADRRARRVPARRVARALGRRIGEQPDARGPDRRSDADGPLSRATRHARARRGRRHHRQHDDADRRATALRADRRRAADGLRVGRLVVDA